MPTSHGLLAGGVGRHPLGIEAALGAHRHDHRILDLLRLDQAQDLGAEILAPVRPADAAARDAPEAQMHALHGRRIDEDFAPGARRRQVVQPGAVEFHGEIRLGRAVLVFLPEAGAQHRVYHILEAANDAVVVQRGNVLQRRVDLLFDGVHRPGAVAGIRGIVPGMKQCRQQAGDIGISHQRLLHIGQAEGHRRLAQELARGPQDGDVAPGPGSRRSPAC